METLNDSHFLQQLQGLKPIIQQQNFHNMEDQITSRY